MGNQFRITQYLRYMTLFDEPIEEEKLLSNHSGVGIRTPKIVNDSMLSDNSIGSLSNLSQIAQQAAEQSHRSITRFSRIRNDKSIQVRYQNPTRFKQLQRANQVLLILAVLRNIVPVVINQNTPGFAYVSDSTLAFDKGRISVILCHLISAVLILYMYGIFDHMRRLHYSHPYRLWLHLFQQRLDHHVSSYEKRRLTSFWISSNRTLYIVFQVYFVCFWPTVFFTYSASYVITYARIYYNRLDRHIYLATLVPNFFLVVYVSYHIYLLLLFTPYLFNVLIQYFLLKLRLLRMRVQLLRSRRALSPRALGSIMRSLLHVLIQLDSANLFWKHAIAVFYLFAVLNTELILFVIFNSYSVPVQLFSIGFLATQMAVLFPIYSASTVYPHVVLCGNSLRSWTRRNTQFRIQLRLTNLLEYAESEHVGFSIGNTTAIRKMTFFDSIITLAMNSLLYFNLMNGS